MSFRLFALPALAVLAVLAACTTMPESASVVVECDATTAQAHVGHVASEDMIQAARKAAGAKTVRVIKPGQAVTMDFRQDRLNLYLDDAGLITRASCS